MRTRIFVLAMSVLLAGCSAFWPGKQRQGVSSSLVDFLYPRGEVPPDLDNVVSNLVVPLRIGLAFVPSRDPTTPGLSEASKNELLAKVRAAFTGREFIGDITIIPETYLRSRNGFETVDQVARLYGLDVMALVSYDQIAHSEDTRASLLYWTIVGAYFIKGTRNDVQTFVDAAVFDVRSRKLLLRAPGIDRIEATTTLINSPEDMRKARECSFGNAMAAMTVNLDQELGTFRERIKADRSVTVTRRSALSSGGSSGGGGALGVAVVAVLWFAVALANASRPKRVCSPSSGHPGIWSLLRSPWIRIGNAN